MDEKLAFEIVLSKLKENPMLCGNYNATNGSSQFMYGICTVMEIIAYNIDADAGDEMSKLFMDNMVRSKEIAQKLKEEE